MQDRNPDHPTDPFPTDATNRREFLLRMAKASAFAAPVVYSVSVGALPAAAMSGAGKSGNCPPGQEMNFGSCTPRGQQPTGAKTGNGLGRRKSEDASWGDQLSSDPVWKAPKPNHPELKPDLPDVRPDVPRMRDPGGSGTRPLGAPGNGGRRDGNPLPGLALPEQH